LTAVSASAPEMPTSEVHIDSRWSRMQNQMNQPVRAGPSASARGLLRRVLPNQRYGSENVALKKPMSRLSSEQQVTSGM
jgi:hypothetical protein